MEMRNSISFVRSLLGIVLVAPTFVFWYIVIRMYAGHYGSHFSDALMFLSGIVTVPIFIVSLLTSVIKRDKGVWMVSALVNATPLLVFIGFWVYIFTFAD